ncbi:MAG: alpha-1,2-fucosyltransferase, partial [Minisyncoccia bacterium]
MIISRIQGGLGNQMFQYACGLSVARAKGVPFKLDIAEHNVASRPYQLSDFNISAEPATPQDFAQAGIPSMSQSLSARIIRKIVRLRDATRPLTSQKVVLESRASFIPELFSVRDNCLLNGNWQSEKYFVSIADTIRKEFTLKNGFGTEAEKFAQMIREEKRGVPVSLHVRRGDVVAIPRFASFHGSPDISYYRDAVKLMREKVGNPVFYVFSDDIPWVEEHLLPELMPAVVVSSPGIK